MDEYEPFESAEPFLRFSRSELMVKDIVVDVYVNDRYQGVIDLVRTDVNLVVDKRLVRSSRGHATKDMRHYSKAVTH